MIYFVSADEKEEDKKTTVPTPKREEKKEKVEKVETKPKEHKEPAKKAQIQSYPRIDLKEIASALAHYEQAALELAGEYPKPAQADYTDYARSAIPHPSTEGKHSLEKFKQNIQIAKLLTMDSDKKFKIPKYLHIGEDISESGGVDTKEKVEADTLDAVMKRFDIPGVEPTLNDYYAETGKINPFAKKSGNVKKSFIETKAPEKKKVVAMNVDPYEYLRNMPPGSSMEPIVDPKARSTIPSDKSYPVFLMKVSPTDEKYVYEDGK